MSDSGCGLGEDGVNWDEFIDCLPLPLSVILLSFVSAGWGAFLVVSHVRALKHTCSRTKETVVAKKMQIFQSWLYSYFFNMVYLSSAFSFISYLLDEQYISAAFLGSAVLISTAMVSTVDVVGSTKRKPGLNPINLKVSLDYLSTFYLPKAVWKMSGHKEFGNLNSEAETGIITKALCLEDVNNHITPKVYDIKDVTAIQGAFLGIPALTVYFLSYIRATSNGSFSPDEDLNGLQKVSAVIAFISALLPPIIGDWELFARNMKLKTLKTIGYTGLSVGKRTLELVGRLGFYLYFLDVSKFAGLALFGVEWTAMRLTMVTKNDAPVGGRTYSIFHKLYSSFEAIFFGFFRRIAVDKELVVQDNSVNATVELIRAVIKGGSTAIGYIALAANDIPESYVKATEGDLVTALFYASVASNVVLVFVEIFEFMVVKKSELNRNDAKLLAVEIRQVICTPFKTQPKHINRDNNMAEGVIDYL